MMNYQPTSHEAQRDRGMVYAKNAYPTPPDARDAYSGSPQVRPRSSIEQNLERIAVGVAGMEEQLERLMARLTPVMSARPEASNPVEKALGHRVESPLGDQAARIADHVERLNRSMSYLIDGVDL